MGIPGLRGGDHIGITVPDMEQAHEFLVGVLGCEFVYALPEMRHDDDWMLEHLNVDPRRAVREIRFYRCGFGVNFEVFEYERHDGQRDVPRNSDLGGHHVAFYVDDMDAAAAYLAGKGVRLLATPSTCAQFLPNADDFAVDPRPPAYRTLELRPDGSLLTEVVWLAQQRGGSSRSVSSAA